MTAATLQNPDNHSKKAPAWRDVLLSKTRQTFPAYQQDELASSPPTSQRMDCWWIAVHFDRGQMSILDGQLADACNRLTEPFDDKGNLLSDLYRKLENDSESEIVALSLVRIFAGAI